MIDIRADQNKVIVRIEKDTDKGFVAIEEEFSIEQAQYFANLLNFSAELATNG